MILFKLIENGKFVTHTLVVARETKEHSFEQVARVLTHPYE